MKAAGKSKVHFVCVAMLLWSAGLLTIAGISLFDSSDLPLKQRVISAVVCLAVAVTYALPALGRTSLANCYLFLVFANAIVMIFCGRDWEFRLTQWTAIYRKAGEMAKVSPFDSEKFGSFLSKQLDSGWAFSIGVDSLWFINFLALIILAQTEKDKEKAALPPSAQENPEAETSV